jgi:hypothetical protein
MSFEGLSRVEFDWSDKRQLFVDLLKLRNIDLGLALLGGVCPPHIQNLGELSIGSIDWWLEWILEANTTAENEWFPNQLGALLAQYANKDAQEQLIAEFNKPSSKFRKALLNFVMPYLKELITDLFSEDAISFLLADLSREPAFREHLLGRTATERFVAERLLPLLSESHGPLRQNLHTVLAEAGSRHGRRYFVE